MYHRPSLHTQSLWNRHQRFIYFICLHVELMMIFSFGIVNMRWFFRLWFYYRHLKIEWASQCQWLWLDLLFCFLTWFDLKLRHFLPSLHIFFYFAEQAHVYLMNCSESAEVCQRQNIGGYPTLAAYRSISWLHHAKCLSVKTGKKLKYARHDYHGLMMVSRASEICYQYLCLCWILNHNIAKQTRQGFVWVVNVNFNENSRRSFFNITTLQFGPRSPMDTQAKSYMLSSTESSKSKIMNCGILFNIPYW